MDRVKELLAAGVSLPDAVRMALKEREVSVSAFADRHDIARSIASEQLNLDRFPRTAFCQALEAELGGAADEWALLFWENGRPAAQAA